MAEWMESEVCVLQQEWEQNQKATSQWLEYKQISSYT